MSPRDFQSELTEQGEQVLVPGVRPVATRDRLRLPADALLRPRRAQRPLDIGLFDDCRRRQLDFFIHGQGKQK